MSAKRDQDIFCDVCEAPLLVGETLAEEDPVRIERLCEVHGLRAYSLPTAGYAVDWIAAHRTYSTRQQRIKAEIDADEREKARSEDQGLGGGSGSKPHIGAHRFWFPASTRVPNTPSSHASSPPPSSPVRPMVGRSDRPAMPRPTTGTPETTTDVSPRLMAKGFAARGHDHQVLRRLRLTVDEAGRTSRLNSTAAGRHPAHSSNDRCPAIGCDQKGNNRCSYDMCARHCADQGGLSVNCGNSSHRKGDGSLRAPSIGGGSHLLRKHGMAFDVKNFGEQAHRLQDDVTQCTLRGIIRNGVNLDISDRNCSLTAAQWNALKIGDILKGVVYQFCPHSAGNWIKRAVKDIIPVLENEQLVLMATSMSENLQSLASKPSIPVRKRRPVAEDDVIVISSDDDDATPVLGKRKVQTANVTVTKRPRY
ncbi:hypothetical protein AURDEDRAFT_128258 [Auricularia subglabra TFB-10046 SS5]|nr:hypothetical protein AURDEDRAFT_128258 [Auricularia subglabra TFB-10046 SS5]